MSRKLLPTTAALFSYSFCFAITFSKYFFYILLIECAK